MKHFRLKFNHGVEIGAYKAYIGHYKRTGDRNIYDIACEEAVHKLTLESILHSLNDDTSPVIDTIFTIIGNIIGRLCAIFPLFMLNFIAMSLEIFAIFSYNGLSRAYPKYKNTFLEMALTEEKHKLYFKGS